MISKASFTCLLLASSAIAYAQDQAPPEPSPSEAASEHEPPKSQPAAAAATATDSKAPKWDVEHPRGLTTRKVPIDTSEGTWMNVDVSPDGSRVLSCDRNDELIVWDTATRSQLFRPDVADHGLIRAIAISPDAKTALVAGERALVSKWDLLGRKRNGEYRSVRGFESRQ